nr:hypothetical protein [Pandoravirus belohorizontensis]
MAGVGRFFFLRLSLSLSFFSTLPFWPVRVALGEGRRARWPDATPRRPRSLWRRSSRPSSTARHATDAAAMATVLQLSAILGLPLFVFPLFASFIAFFCHAQPSAGWHGVDRARPIFFLRKCAPTTKTTSHQRDRDVPWQNSEKKRGRRRALVAAVLCDLLCRPRAGGFQPFSPPNGGQRLKIED